VKNDSTATGKKSSAKKATEPARDSADQQRKKEEPKEVIGRHQNDGQKDHKGAR